MARFLIVNADDFGLTEGVSRGILKAHREGLVTSTTFMTNFPWAPQMAPLLASAPDLGVGIHLNLTTGRPVLPAKSVPSLVTKEGSFCRALFHLIGRVDPRDVEREWGAQIERGIDLLGRTPTHLDTHRYLQGYPAFAEVFVRLAARYGIPAVRSLYPGAQMRPSGRLGVLNPANYLVDRYLRRSAEIVAASGLGCPHATLVGDFDWDRLRARLASVEEGVTELVSHPGCVDDSLRQISSLVEQRAVELSVLVDPAARARVAELGIQLVHFGHLAKGG
jgi:predicted glycoside hydrolase/deacetylase ChbG (UPF0249 family)